MRNARVNVRSVNSVAGVCACARTLQTSATSRWQASFLYTSGNPYRGILHRLWPTLPHSWILQRQTRIVRLNVGAGNQSIRHSPGVLLSGAFRTAFSSYAFRHPSHDSGMLDCNISSRTVLTAIGPAGAPGAGPTCTERATGVLSRAVCVEMHVVAPVAPARASRVTIIVMATGLRLIVSAIGLCVAVAARASAQEPNLAWTLRVPDAQGKQPFVQSTWNDRCAAVVTATAVHVISMNGEVMWSWNYRRSSRFLQSCVRLMRGSQWRFRRHANA